MKSARKPGGGALDASAITTSAAKTGHTGLGKQRYYGPFRAKKGRPTTPKVSNDSSCIRSPISASDLRTAVETKLSVDGGDGYAVLGPRFFVRADDNRAFLAIADSRDPGCGNPRGDKDVLDRLSAALAESQIIFAGAALIAMTFDRHGDVRVAPQPISLTGQDLLRFRGDIRSVKSEEDAIASACLQILLRSRYDVPRTDAAGTRAPRRPGGGRFRRRAAASGKQQQSTQQTDYSCMHINPPSTGSDNIAALFTEARETKPDRKHPAGWLPRVD